MSYERYERAKAECKRAENELRAMIKKCLATGAAPEDIAARINFSVEGLYAFAEYQGSEPL